MRETEIERVNKKKRESNEKKKRGKNQKFEGRLFFGSTQKKNYSGKLENIKDCY